MARHMEAREAAKQQLLRERHARRQAKMLGKIKSQQKWRRKMTQSPYTVNLVAEHERIEEEVNARLAEEHALERRFEKRRQQVRACVCARAWWVVSGVIVFVVLESSWNDRRWWHTHSLVGLSLVIRACTMVADALFVSLTW